MSSSPPASHVPYQPYKPRAKRNSYTPSIAGSNPSAPSSPPPQTPPKEVVGYPFVGQQNGGAVKVEEDENVVLVLEETVPVLEETAAEAEAEIVVDKPIAVPVPEISVQGAEPMMIPEVAQSTMSTPWEEESSSAPVASSSSTLTPTPDPRPSLLSTTRKTSKFRRITPGRPPLPSSPLAPPTHSRTSSTSSLQPVSLNTRAPPSDSPRSPDAGGRMSSVVPSLNAGHPPHHRAQSLTVIPAHVQVHVQTPPRSDSLNASVVPAHARTHSSPPPLTTTPSSSSTATFTSTSSSMIMSPSSGRGTPLPALSPSSTASSSPLPPISRSSSASSSNTPTSTPIPAAQSTYRPGFQPKGVYRPRTDTFLAARRAARDVGRIERTKLERRLEKIVALHFPVGSGANGESANGAATGSEKLNNGTGTGTGPRKRPGPAPIPAGRRASSFFDLDFGGLRDSLRDDPGGLLKGVLGGQAEGSVRAAEQRITPWQDDKEATRCFCCSTPFHPLTTRKHHCRLCGLIICALPPSPPSRPVPCSILFVVDPRTRRIEEVKQGVDYGVRRRTASNAGKKSTAGEMEEEDKFLKGVRVCRVCRPVIMRQQAQQELGAVPTFVRLYNAFIALESEIEEQLPQFHELVLSLNNASSSSSSNNSTASDSKALSAARKRLLDAFAQYDALAKRIRASSSTSKSGSQERVVGAIMTRANLFLQKNMVPLQSLPTLKPLPKPPSPSLSQSTSTTELAHTPRETIDPDSTLAHLLQPLLEQEALLESFVEEANAHRKFEDARTLKANLLEVREEIGRVVREGKV